MSKYWLLFIALFLGIAPVLCFAQDYSVEKIFYLPRYNAVAGVESLEKNWQKIDILAPQMHVVEGNFMITGKFGPKLKKSIADHNLKVMPLVANANFSQSIMHKLLTSPIGQDLVIAQLLLLAKTQNYIGWQYDFENISYKDKDLFTAFVEKTYKKFKENSLVFSVVAVPRTTDYENTNAFKNWSGVYDYKKIAENSDFVSLMVYDDPNSVGPVASITFVNKMLAYVKDKIPANKLSLGVPLYYWKWSADSDKKIGSGLYKNILAIKNNFIHTTGFDNDLGVSWLAYVFKNKEYKIWFEDKKSFETKLGIVQDNKLRGFSAWLLGGEDQAIWTLFK
jgi:spore germination protein YaaH